MLPILFSANSAQMRAALCAGFVVFQCAVGDGVVAQELHVDRDADNLVRFVSRTPFDEFEGITDRIDGYALLSSPDSSSGGQHVDGALYFEVDLASVDTGIGLRNRHMRDNYLEVESFPYAVFDGSILSVDSTAAPNLSVLGRGDMSIHGVTREMDIVCEVTAEDLGYRSRCNFQILLSDFGIKIPKVMFLKLADEIHLELEFVMKPAESS